MKIVLRADASVHIGSGHVMRCITLAEALREQGADVAFICRDLPGNLFSLLLEKGFSLYKLSYPESNSPGRSESLNPAWPADAAQTCQILKSIGPVDWLVVDHYGLDYHWEEEQKPWVKKLAVIDDLANRRHVCDVLLDQNLYGNCESRYQGLIPESCLKLLGPAFALLRQEFRLARYSLSQRDGSIKRILVFFGGADASNETHKAVKALMSLENANFLVNVVVGASNPHREQIEALCAQLVNFNYYCQVNNMAELMAGADLAIGAGGSTTWERCFLGLPAVTIILADNQAETTQAVAETGAIINLGYYHRVTTEDIARTVQYLYANPHLVQSMSQAAFDLMGGNLKRNIDLVQLMVGEQC